MAIFAATDYKVTVNGTDFSAKLTQVELEVEAAVLETTVFGQGWETKTAGMKKGQVKLDFNQDFAASSVDATLMGLLGSYATVVVTPTSAAVSATNPSYTAVCLVDKYQPFSSSVGDLATTSVTWPTSGTVTRGTS